MAAPTLGQNGVGETIVSNTITVSPTGLTTGSTLVIGVVCTSNVPAQTYSISDSTNSYSSAVGPVVSTGVNPGRGAQIFYAPNISTSGGALTVVVTRANGTGTFRVQFVELLGAHASSPLDVTGSESQAADNLNHNFAAGGITTASDVFVYCIASANSSIGTFAPTTSPAFTQVPAVFSSTASVAQYYSNSTGLSANTLAYSGSSSRTAASVSASFIGAAAGGGGGVPHTNRSLLGGVG